MQYSREYNKRRFGKARQSHGKVGGGVELRIFEPFDTPGSPCRTYTRARHASLRFSTIEPSRTPRSSLTSAGSKRLCAASSCTPPRAVPLLEGATTNPLASSRLSSLFKVPNKRCAQDVDARTVSTTPNACDDASNDHADNMPPPTAPEDNQAAGKRREEETAPSVVTPLRRANDVDVADVVTAARRICDGLDTNTMRLTGAESELSAASTRALLAASPLRNRPEREAVFQVARRLWNICVGRTNDMLTDVTATRTYSLARADDLAKKRRDAAAMTNLRERCCDLLDASIRSADLSKMSPRDARVGLTFASKTAILLHEENAYERAEEMFERAETYARVLQTWLESRDKADGKDVRRYRSDGGARL